MKIADAGKCTSLSDKQVREVTACFSKLYARRYSVLGGLIDQGDFVDDCWVKFLTYFDPEKSSVTTFAYLSARNVSQNVIDKRKLKKHAESTSFVEYDDGLHPPTQRHKERSFVLVYDVEHVLEEVRFGDVEARFLLQKRSEGYTYSEISKLVYDSYGRKVTGVCIRGWLEEVFSVIKGSGVLP